MMRQFRARGPVADSAHRGMTDAALRPPATPGYHHHRSGCSHQPVAAIGDIDQVGRAAHEHAQPVSVRRRHQAGHGATSTHYTRTRGTCPRTGILGIDYKDQPARARLPARGRVLG